MDRQAKQRYWTRHVRAYESGDWSRTAYCKRHRLSVSSLDYWRSRLAASDAKPGFVAVQARPVAPSPGLTLARTGATLTLPRDCDPLWLAQLLSGLRPC